MLVELNIRVISFVCFFFIFVSYKVKQWLPVMPDEVSQFGIKMTMITT